MKNMPKKLLAFFFVTHLLSTVLPAQSVMQESFLIDDFENSDKNGFPTKWYDRDVKFIWANGSDFEKSNYYYRILEENGNKFLRYDGIIAKHMTFPLREKQELNIYETPILNWKWRVHDIPEGANEDSKYNNDTAASIYVAFDLGRVLFKKVPKSIRYTWSSSLSVGTELSKFHGNQKIIVIGTGKEGLGEWKSYQRNIVEDYKRLFGDDPPQTPLAILILSDGNSTNKNAKADYDDIFLSSSPDN